MWSRSNEVSNFVFSGAVWLNCIECDPDETNFECDPDKNECLKTAEMSLETPWVVLVKNGPKQVWLMYEATSSFISLLIYACSGTREGWKGVLGTFVFYLNFKSYSYRHVHAHAVNNNRDNCYNYVCYCYNRKRYLFLSSGLLLSLVTFIWYDLPLYTIPANNIQLRFFSKRFLLSMYICLNLN